MTLHPDQHEIDFLCGYLLFNFKAKGSPDWLSLIDSANCKVETGLPSEGWYLLHFISDVPLLKEAPDQPPPFTYRVVLRTSGKKALLLSSGRKIVTHLLDNAISQSHRRALSKVLIDVDSLVRCVTDAPDFYLLTYVHARVNAFGDALNYISFYGDDISRASLFREQCELLTAYTCGIRDISSKDELIRIGNNGYVSFSFKKSKFGLEIDKILGYINEKGFLRAYGAEGE